jgi:DNA replication licensing factor MCM4
LPAAAADHYLVLSRFGEQLRSSMVKEFYWHYIAYEELKDLLKTPFETEPTPENPNPKRKPWTEENEKHFVAVLEAELDKVFTFQKLKSDEIVRRIKASEQEVNEVLQLSAEQNGDQQEPRRQRARAPTDEDFFLLEEDLSDIIADVHDLAKYTQLNYTGFQKIIKKHDVRWLSSTFRSCALAYPGVLYSCRNKPSGT